MPGTGTGTVATEAPPPPCPVCAGAATGFLLAVEGRDYWHCRHCQATFLDPHQLPDAGFEHAQYRLHRNDVDDAAAGWSCRSPADGVALLQRPAATGAAR